MILVYSNLEGLDFRSSVGGINQQRYNSRANRYEILVSPQRQILFVAARGFIEQRIALINPRPKAVFLYIVEERKEQDEVSVVFLVEPKDAKLFVDNIPTDINKTVNVPLGQVNIRLEREGYLMVDDIVEINSSQVNYELKMYKSRENTNTFNCDPKVGDKFELAEEGVLFYNKPDFNSIVAFESIGFEDVSLTCVNETIYNGFIEVSLYLETHFEEYGINLIFGYIYRYYTYHLKQEISFKTFMLGLKNNEFRKKVYYDILNSDGGIDFLSQFHYVGKKPDIINDKKALSFEDFKLVCLDSYNEYQIKLISSHKNVYFVSFNSLKSNKIKAISLGDFGSNIYLEYVSSEIELLNNRSCEYSESGLIFFFKHYIDALISEQQYFTAIEKIKHYSKYFHEDYSNNTLDFLRMKAAYFDNNYWVSFTFGKKYVENFLNSGLDDWSEFGDFGEYSVGKALSFLISSLLQLERYEDAVYFCELAYDNNFYFKEFVDFYIAALININDVDKACEFLTKIYINGYEDAKEYIQDICK